MNIFDIFKGPANAVQSQAATQQATPGNMPLSASPMNPVNNGVVPGDAQIQTAAKTPESPMEGMKDLWHTDPNAKKPEPNPLFAIDPAKLADAVKKQDFSKAIPPELMTRINAGGEDAQKALVEAMNSMVQANMSQGTVLTTKIVEQALARQKDDFMAAIPEIIKNQGTREAMRGSNPILQNPATAPIMEAVLAQIQQKYPTESAAEHQKLADQWVTGFAEIAQAPAKDAANKKSQANDTDWGAFLTEAQP